MKNNNRLYNLLAAGSLTVLLLLTFLLFQSNRFGGVADAATTAVNATIALPAPSQATVVDANTRSNVTTSTQTSNDQTLQTLQAQNQKLLQAVQVLQQREQQYQTQLNNASQALQTLQTQSAAPGAARGEHEEYEHEHGEHEYGDAD